MSNQSVDKSPKWLKIKPTNANNKEQIISSNNVQKKPKWLRVKLPTGENYKRVRNLVSDNNLHTICESGNCPNMGECWGEGTATFMILGNICFVPLQLEDLYQ